LIERLRAFFKTPDPVSKVAAGLNEPEAMMLVELLEEHGIPAYPRNMTALSIVYGGQVGNEFDLFVRTGDLSAAQDLVEPLVRPGQLSPREPAAG
jgi:hypothetical protein